MASRQYGFRLIRGRCLRRPIFNQLDRAHRAYAANISHHPEPGAPVSRDGFEKAADVFGSLWQIETVYSFEGFESGRAGYGVASEGSTQSAGTRRIHNLRAPCDRCQRKSAGHRFSGEDDVRLEAKTLARE